MQHCHRRLVGSVHPFVRAPVLGGALCLLLLSAACQETPPATDDTSPDSFADVTPTDVNAPDTDPSDADVAPDTDPSDADVTPDSDPGDADVTPDSDPGDADVTPDSDPIDGGPGIDEAAPTWAPESLLSVVALGPKSVKLQWPAAVDNVAVTGYRVFQDGDMIQTTEALEATVVELVPETAYIFGVEAVDAAGNASVDGPTLEVTTPAETWTNAIVYELLKPNCKGCHETGTVPFFADLEAFENGLVWNTKFIVPGDPEASELMAILAGDGTQGYVQMPPGEAAFSDLAAQDKTLITMEDLKEWIEDLSLLPPGEATAPTDVVLNRRLRAEQLVRSLYDHLGLVGDDFFASGSWYGYFPNIGKAPLWKYPVRGPDDVPGFGVNSGQTEVASIERFISLGGPDFGDGQRRNQTIGPTFLHTLTQTAQAHCRLSITKPGNQAVLKFVTLADTSATNSDGIENNIAYLFLRFLGEEPEQAEIQALKTDVFEVYESLSGTEAAWVAVCASILRDPRWITY